MDFDEILEEIGAFGKYQKINYLLICLPVMFAAANSLSYVFTAGIPKYRCFIPECDNKTNPTYNEHWIENAVPGTKTTNGIFLPEQCLKFRLYNNSFSSKSEEIICPAEMYSRRNVTTCNQWVFDNSEKTIVQEWNITCSENAWKLAFVGTMHFAGLVVGTATSGFLADKFGRKNIFILSIIFMSITGILQGVSWDYNSFLFFTFLNAVGTSGVYPLAFIIGVEMVGPKMREMSSIVLNYFYAVGEAIIGLFAWFCHDWQILQFSLSAPPIIFILYYWFIPESVRWLLANNEYQKAEKIIRHVAYINKKQMTHTVLSTFVKNDTNKNDNDYDEDNLNENDINQNEILMENQQIYKTFKMAIKSKILLLRFLLLFYLWIANSLVFYGLSLNSTNLSGNKYLNFSLICLVEIPGYTLAWILMKKTGRRWSLSASFLLCALTCIAGGYISSDLTWLIISLSLIGKLGVTSSFAIIYVYTAEMIPTIIRSGGVGCMSTVARFGAMIAPFVPLLGTNYKPLPLLLFGIISLIAALLSFILPETFKQKLPDTIEEAELMGKKL